MRTPVAFAAALVCIAACGGGGGSGGAPTPGSSLAPTFSLTTASPSSVGVARTDVDAVLNLAFTDAAVQTALVVKNGYVVGERYASGCPPTAFANFDEADCCSGWRCATLRS